MSAEPVQVDDPNDPAVILRDLPERERAQFLRQYHEAVDAAHDPAGDRQLQRLLHAWRLTVIATSRTGYYEELAAVQQRQGADDASRGSLPGLAGAVGGGAGSGTVTYRAALSERVLGQLEDFPAKAFDALIATMAAVVEYPDDPMQTFPTGDPYVRRAEFGPAGLVTYVINDGRRTVTLTDVTWAG